MTAPRDPELDRCAESLPRWIRVLRAAPPARLLLNAVGALADRGRYLVIALPSLWLGLFFLVPFAIVLKISFAEQIIALPPYSPLFETNAAGELALKLHLDSYRFLIADALYWKAYLSSMKVAFVSALCCLVLGYPMAYGIARSDPAWRQGLLMLVILPFWTSFLLRVYAWIGLLNTNGIINNALLGLGIIEQPLPLLRTEFAIYLGIVYSYLPFMVLPLYATLEKMDPTLLEAAADLGCRPFRAFVTITLPLSLPGIVAGFALVFIPALGEFVIPDLLGGAETLMIGHVLWNEFFVNRAWPVASAVAVAMLALVLGLMVIQRRLLQRAEGPA